jgi:hypothetical protein
LLFQTVAQICGKPENIEYVPTGFLFAPQLLYHLPSQPWAYIVEAAGYKYANLAYNMASLQVARHFVSRPKTPCKTAVKWCFLGFT